MITRSKYFPDEAINPHPRFATLVENIRARRGSKVVINVPIFPDRQTKDPFQEINEDALFPDASDESAAISQNIYMDCMGFGMGCCCLQTTFQAFCINEARKIYDQLVPMAPIVMALTAATPIFRGYLVNTDCRWDVISASVDDRTAAERGKIRKSRYGSVSRYIFNGNRNKPEYNDLPLFYNENIYEKLCDTGIDELLGKHLAHLYIRDPLVIYEELLEQDNWNSTDHFENIQSTNWQTLRFKPPPANTDIGWRVEFRSMEVQPDDHGNAAFSIFIVLLARTIFFFNLNFYLPLSLVDINMDRSHGIDAVLNKKFHFRINVFSGIHLLVFFNYMLQMIPQKI
jgi:glutamate--cysteine ligase catalytic subunit